MNKISSILVVMALLVTASVVQANVIISTVTVGNAGNTGYTVGSATWGAVAYNYKMGKYEVTNTEYAAFLNAVGSSTVSTYGLLSSGSTQITYSGGTYTVNSGYANKPVDRTCWYDEVRFANWLTNGQPTGGTGTETGAYTITGGGVNSGTVSVPSTSQRATLAAGSTASWVIPSMDEWVKAGYYDPTLNSGAGGYYYFATRSNTAPAKEAAPGTNTTNGSANYGLSGSLMTDVGSYTFKPSTSYYGTYDMAGNAWERIDPRGGNWYMMGGSANTGSSDTQQDIRNSNGGNFDSNARDPNSESSGNIGFRIALLGGEEPPPSGAVPEPAALSLIGVALLAIARRRK